LLLTTGAILAQCNFSALEPGPSAREKKPPRTAFPVFGRDGSTLYIDKNGRPVPHAQPTEKGLTVYREFVDGHPRYGFRDPSGAIKISPQYLDADGFHDGLAAVKDASDSWGYVDEAGKMRIPARFHGAGGFSDGLAAVDLCNQCGYIDREGKQVFAAGFRHCYRFSGDVAKVEIGEGKWGFIDKSGKVLATLSGGGGEGQLFSEGLMASEKAGAGVGFANMSGEFVVGPRFAFVQPFSEGLAAVKENETWGYIDKTGHYVIPAQFGDPEDPRGGAFEEGLAFVTDPKTKLHGFIDRTGKYTIKPIYSRCNDPSGEHCAFDGGLAWVETSKSEGYIDTQGKFVWSTPVGQGRKGQ
jgi:hypothetical protein